MALFLLHESAIGFGLFENKEFDEVSAINPLI